MPVKRALLVGCNYTGTENELKGCVNDVLTVYDRLVNNFGFAKKDIVLMVDTDGKSISPTGANIKGQLKKLISASTAGDVLVFHFSGHGTQIPSKDNDEADRLDEAICPTDLNLISDDDLKMYLSALDPGCKFTMISDSCHSGTLLDQGTVVISGSKSFKRPRHSVMRGMRRGAVSRFLPVSNLVTALAAQVGDQMGEAVTQDNILETLAQLFKDDASVTCSRDFDARSLDTKKIVLISGCQSSETSADAYSEVRKKPMGALTDALVNTLDDHLEHTASIPLTNRALVTDVRKLLKHQGFDQHPCLECIQATADTPFLVNDWSEVNRLPAQEPATDELTNLSKEEIDLITAFFKYFDTDCDGLLTVQEIVRGSAMDIDGDGQITREEGQLAAAPWLAMIDKQDLDKNRLVSLEELLKWNNAVRVGMKLSITEIGGKETLPVEVSPRATVADLKAKIETATGKPRNTVALAYAGTLLEDSRLPSEYNIKDGDVLFMI